MASCVSAPALLLADPDGHVHPGGVSGWFVSDVRLLDRLELTIDGSALEMVRAETSAADSQTFAYVARSLGDRIADPTVVVERTRRLADEELVEDLEVVSASQEEVEVVLRLAAGGDLAPMAEVKQGGGGRALPPEVGAGTLSWTDGSARVEVRTTPHATIEDGVLVWRARLGHGGRLGVRVRMAATVPTVFRGGRPAPWHGVVHVEASDLRVRRTAEQSLADLEGLLLRDPDAPAGQEDRFLAAGSPWFLTLFGRDSLWAARMLLPLDTDLALSTLRVLARRQGERHDVTTEEEPGKILHEVRGELLDLGEQTLPPVYFGSVDATPLWLALLAEAHDWGADPGQVRALLPAARRAVEWVRAQTADGGWLRYVDHTGQGLANQGWKDSHDSVQYADGRLAEPPIALSEVQAYAWEACVRAEQLFHDFDEEPPAGLRDFTDDLRRRFVRDFWVGSPEDGHLAIAIDRTGRRVDSITSNMGHVLATGILQPPYADRVAALLSGPELDSGFGLRTLTTESPRFSRLSYHGGTVWPHDTAIAVTGLAAMGRFEEAGALAAGLMRAAESFDYRLPELYGGDASGAASRPTAYPAACRPQAWSAAAPLACLLALTGLRVSGDGRTLTHPARTAASLGGFRLRGLRLGRHSFDVAVDDSGTVAVTVPDGSPVRVVVG